MQWDAFRRNPPSAICYRHVPWLPGVEAAAEGIDWQRPQVRFRRHRFSPPATSDVVNPKGSQNSKAKVVAGLIKSQTKFSLELKTGSGKIKVAE